MSTIERRIAIWHTLCVRREVKIKTLAKEHNVSWITISSVQVSRELITPNGCHVKMLFPQTSSHGIRREIAQLLLTAFMREKEVECIS